MLTGAKIILTTTKQRKNKMKKLLILIAMIVTLNHASALEASKVQAYGNDHASMVYDSAENCVALNMSILESYEDAVKECKNISPTKIKTHCIYNCEK